MFKALCSVLLGPPLRSHVLGHTVTPCHLLRTHQTLLCSSSPMLQSHLPCTRTPTSPSPQQGLLALSRLCEVRTQRDNSGGRGDGLRPQGGPPIGSSPHGCEVSAPTLYTSCRMDKAQGPPGLSPTGATVGTRAVPLLVGTESPH